MCQFSNVRLAIDNAHIAPHRALDGGSGLGGLNQNYEVLYISFLLEGWTQMGWTAHLLMLNCYMVYVILPCYTKCYVT